MAMQAEGQGQAHELAEILKRRFWQVLLPAVVALALGVCVAALLPRRYKVETVLELRQVPQPLGGGSVSLQTVSANASWYIKSAERVRRVIDKLEWQDFAALPTPELRREYLDRVIGDIKVAAPGPGPGSLFIKIEYTDADPQRAERFLNELRDTFVAEVLERERNDARTLRSLFQEEAEEAHERYLEMEEKHAQLLRKHGLSSTQQAPGAGRQRDEDPVYRDLNTFRGQLLKVGVDLAEERGNLEAFETQYAEEPPFVSQSSLAGGDVAFAQTIADLEATKADMRREIKEKGLKRMHPRAKFLERQIELADEQMDQLRGLATSPEADMAMVENPLRAQLLARIQAAQANLKGLSERRDALAAQIDELSAKHEMLSGVYRESKEIEGEVNRQRQAYLDASGRLEAVRDRVELLEDPQLEPFDVMQVAEAPRLPTSPSVPLILMLSLAIGLGVGLGSALLAEFGRNAFRNAGEVARGMAVPVLGAINRIVTRDEERRLRLRRALVGSSTAILTGLLLWITWAYVNKPRLLGSELTQLIDDLRSQFR